MQREKKGRSRPGIPRQLGRQLWQIPLRSAMERAPGESSRLEERSRFHTDIGEFNRRSEQVKKKEFLCPPVGGHCHQHQTVPREVAER